MQDVCPANRFRILADTSLILAADCPHVSVHNPLAPPNAPPRESVETRNLVITRIDDG
ncbi:hypothetical protein BDP81DRAFT_429249, partial [Colletotrichum phormii]